jgi:hypothetical protein
MKYRKAKRLARKWSEDDFTAVTKDNKIVTTLDCVRYQLRNKNLKRIYYQGVRLYFKMFESAK